MSASGREPYCSFLFLPRTSDPPWNTLYVRIHRMASVHDRAIAALLEQLNQETFLHPETGMRILYTFS